MEARPIVNKTISISDEDGSIYILLNTMQAWVVNKQWIGSGNEEFINISFQRVVISMKKEVFNKFFKILI